MKVPYSICARHPWVNKPNKLTIRTKFDQPSTVAFLFHAYEIGFVFWFVFWMLLQNGKLFYHETDLRSITYFIFLEFIIHKFARIFLLLYFHCLDRTKFDWGGHKKRFHSNVWRKIDNWNASSRKFEFMTTMPLKEQILTHDACYSAETCHSNSIHANCLVLAFVLVFLIALWGNFLLFLALSLVMCSESVQSQIITD